MVSYIEDIGDKCGSMIQGGLNIVVKCVIKLEKIGWKYIEEGNIKGGNINIW